jgi:branched-chain amino acid aminotransferase
MPLKKTEKIWHNGKLIPWDDAQIHVLSHVVHYGSSVFEGVRCYETRQGPATFRLRDHMRRLVNSGRIYYMDNPYSVDQLCDAAAEVVRTNRMSSCYLRPVVLRGYGEIGVSPLKCPIEVYIACWEWGAYLGSEALEQGVDVCVSSWARLAPNTLPAMAKAAANYMNSQLIKMEALRNGYSEGIGLDPTGHVSEGSGENIFLVLDNRVYTPPLSSAGLAGITRSSVLTLCEDLDIQVREEMIPREMLYVADEVFFTGTAAEITPLRSIDRMQVGAGKRGPITKRLQEEFFAILTGAKQDRHNWLVPVSAPVSATIR